MSEGLPCHVSLRLRILAPVVLAFSASAAAQPCERLVIDQDFPGAYQVEIADVNGDRRPDVVAVGGGTCAWYENPSWKKRLVSTPRETPGIISSATADLDGDGKAEIAIAHDFAMENPAMGKLVMAIQGKGIEDAWRLEEAAAIPSIHRLRFGDVDGDHRLDLVVAPIFGLTAHAPDYSDPAQLVVLRGLRPGVRVRPEVIGRWPIIHAIEVGDFWGEGRSWIVAATDQGTPLVHWGGRGQASPAWIVGRRLTGAAKATPTHRGASEVHIGRMADGARLLATIEPWHGTSVVAYQAHLDETERPELDPVRDRQIVDDSLRDGHALWLADVDGDGDDEILAGCRGPGHNVSLYDFDRRSIAWKKTVLDSAIAAQDLRGGDIDGDGAPDVASVGGSTHNVVLYRFKKAPVH